MSSTESSAAPHYRLHAQASSIIRGWRASRAPDAAVALREHPELAGQRALVIDLAYEEYCLREERGEPLDPSLFCRKFPEVQQSLGRMLQVHQFMRSSAVGMSSPAELDWPEVNTVWLNWELIELLGRGAFSRVFLARDLIYGGRLTVVKCAALGGEEAFLMGRCEHPNIMPVYFLRHDHDSEWTGLSMPFVGRETLAELISQIHALNDSRTRDGAIRPAEAERLRRVLLGVARGLAAAHERQVRHGDIKPTNVVLADDGEPKIVDFNLSAAKTGSDAIIGGTPPYLAPECVRCYLADDAAQEVTLASDIYSFGVMLYECFAGVPPSGRDAIDLAQLAAPPPPEILPRPTAMDDALWSIAVRCLQPEPARRYASAVELAAELEAYSAQQRLTQSRRKWLAVAGTAGLATLGAAAAAAEYYRQRYSPRAIVCAELQQAIDYIAADDYVLALEYIRRVRAKSPSAALTTWEAYCHAYQGHNGPAISMYEQAIREGLDVPSSHTACGYCYKRLGFNEQAEVVLTKVLDTAPSYQLAWHNRGRARLSLALQKKRPFAGSWADLERALELGPENAILHLDMAYCIAFCRAEKLADEDRLRWHLARALAHGADPKQVANSSAFNKLGLAALQELARQQNVAQPNPGQLFPIPPVSLQDELARLQRE